jgi:DNA-directed RNA polymerase II subunit RPB2
MCYVTVGTPSDPIVEFMIQRSMEVLEEYEPLRSPNATKVFVNGVWVGVHRDPAHLVQTVRDLRRSHHISYEVSLIRDIRDREFKIFTDAGRVCRPLFVIDNDVNSKNKGNLVLNKSHIKRLEDDATLPLGLDLEEKQERGYFGFQGLIDEGVVEYVDAEEEETVMIVMTPEDLEISRQLQAGYQIQEDNSGELNRRVKAPMKPTAHIWTHCEIHPSMILGICASIIPFPDHNQVRESLKEIFINSNLPSHRVIRTSPPWESKPWVCFLQTLISGWTLWQTSSIIRRSLWRRLDLWST